MFAANLFPHATVLRLSEDSDQRADRFPVVPIDLTFRNDDTGEVICTLPNVLVRQALDFMGYAVGIITLNPALMGKATKVSCGNGDFELAIYGEKTGKKWSFRRFDPMPG